MTLAWIGLRVVELPALVREVTPGVRRGRGHRRCLPAVVPDRACAEHRVELRLLALCARVEERRGEALALERVLREAFDHLRRLDAEQFVDRRDDVHGMRVLASDA